jgi:hypothetical protein
MLQQRPNTFAQTILSLSFFACDEAADHTFRFARYPPRVDAKRGDHFLQADFSGLGRFCGLE